MVKVSHGAEFKLEEIDVLETMSGYRDFHWDPNIGNLPLICNELSVKSVIISISSTGGSNIYIGKRKTT